ncbi:hypothetical protein MYX65_10745 [Acidobacteria bacterium AH-259-L09]|nr:hypothetical protein [Acidobacteria bacterium AH-259-L09]
MSKKNFLIIAGVVINLVLMATPGFAANEKYVQIEDLQVRMLQRDTLVDYTLVRKKGQINLHVFVRDVDNIVKSYRVEYQDVDNQSRGGPIFEGYAINFDDVYDLPPTEIPIRAVKASCLEGGVRYESIVTLGMEKRAPFAPPNYNLYVFKRLDQGPLKIYEVKAAGRNLLDFRFLDLDGDCLPEMIDLSKPAGLSFLKVRKIDSNDRVHVVQEIGGKGISLLHFFSRLLSITMREDGILSPLKDYKWDPTAGKFVETAP